MTTPLNQFDAAIARLGGADRDGLMVFDEVMAAEALVFLRTNAETLRAALADAERYRWLRDPQRLPEGATDEYGHVYVGISGLDKWAVASVEADAAIDRAIAASKEPT